MAFIFSPSPPSQVYRGNDHFVIDIVLGYDLDSNERVLESVAFFDADANDSGVVHELAFGIRTQNIDSGVVSGFAFDHATARRYVTRERADVVSFLILRAIGELVTEIHPSQIAMETHENKLPAEAMGKYMKVISKLGLLGFGMTTYRRDATDFKDYWFFSR